MDSVSGLADDKDGFKAFMRRVRKAVGGNNKSASHATRVAGTENFKATSVPVVEVSHAAPGRIMTAEQPQNIGLVSEPEPVMLPAFKPSMPISFGDRPWPRHDITRSRTRPAN